MSLYKSIWSVVVIMVLTDLHFCFGDFLIRTKGKIGISMVLTPAYARKAVGGFEGFLPELLNDLHKLNGITQYRIIEASGNELGTKKDGNWTGLIGDVIRGEAHIGYGVGPILDSGEYRNEVLLSKPWTAVHLTLVVKSSSKITSLQMALDNAMDFRVVQGSPEEAKVKEIGAKSASSPLNKLMGKLNQSRRTATVLDGLSDVSRENNVALVLNTEDATYHVTHDFCDLTIVTPFAPLGNYTFALQLNDSYIEPLNNALEKMKKDVSLEKLHRKWVGVVGLGACSEARSTRHGGLTHFLIVLLGYLHAFHHNA